MVQSASGIYLFLYVLGFCGAKLGVVVVVGVWSNAFFVDGWMAWMAWMVWMVLILAYSRTKSSSLGLVLGSLS